MNPRNGAPDGFDPLCDLALKAPPALALSGLRDDASFRASPAPGPRAPIEAAARLGFRAVVLDATAPGLRPRDLDRSSRRDLASLLRRLELAFAGLDLWIPPEHFASAEHADRASSACVGAIDLVADLARESLGQPIACIVLPRALEGERLVLFEGVLRGLIDHADRAGVTLADHALPLGEAQGAPNDASSPLAIGVDPAAILLRDGDPVLLTAKWGSRVRVARWSDADSVSRVAPMNPSKGRLDLLAYAATVASATAAQRFIVDLRGVAEPLASAGALARTLH
jgi:hypothetical protein